MRRWFARKNQLKQEQIQTQSDPEAELIQRSLDGFHEMIMSEPDQTRMLIHLAREFERDPTLLGRQLGILAAHPLVVAYMQRIRAMAQTYGQPTQEEASAQPGAPTSGDGTFTQLVMTWLRAGPLPHSRRFLEAHPELLDPRTLTVLESLMPPPNADPRAEEAGRNFQDIIRDIVTYYATARDVPAAYVNVFGGFALDLPYWLEAEIMDIAAIVRETPLDRSALERSRRCRTAWKRASQERLAPEILAELAERIADALTDISDETLPQAQDEAIAWYERAQLVFTEQRYPRQWAHGQHHLGLVYCQRLQGSKTENQERAITYYEAALRVYTEDRFPEKWAMIQNNLGNVYAERLLGGNVDNQELAIAYYIATLRVYTEERWPIEWADTQVNLGNVCHARIAGDRAENQERAIACYSSALRVYSKDRFPEGWARVQFSLGNVYQERKKGDSADNQKQAIAYYNAALHIFTQVCFPHEWALTQNNLGGVYEQRIQGEKVKNLEQAVGYYEAALHILRATGEHYRAELVLANLYNELGRWQEAQATYARVRQDNQLLLSLAETTQEQDPILRSESERVFGEAFAFARPGRLIEAALCVERGRARALAAARKQLTIDPSHIRDPHLQQRYRRARDELQKAQAASYAPLPMLGAPRRVVGVVLGEVESPPSPDWLQRKAAISAARQAFDACLAEIASSQAIADFMQTEVPETVFSDALACCPANHALVYLLATHWGGLALIVCGTNSASGIKSRVLSLDLPDLTWDMVEELIDHQIDVGYQDVIGGFAWGQTGSAFGRFRALDWTGDTFAERAASLHSACRAVHKQGSFDVTTQAICAMSEFADILDEPLNELAHHASRKLAAVAGVFDHEVLLHEIRRGLTTLATVAMRPLATRLREQG